MPTLRELQRTVMQAVLGAEPEPALALLGARGERAAAQMRVYQNTAQANFRESLRSSYPVIARLVGDNYFSQIAHGLQRRRPSRSGDLLWVGQHFPDYLAELHAADDYQYLADVARLEWLCQESLLAPAHGPLDLAKLAATAAETHPQLIFLMHPTLRFFQSRFPVLRIWECNVAAPGREQEIIDLASGADRLLIVRHQQTLQFHRLNAGEQRFLTGLSAQCTFGAIVEECLRNDPRFDASATLRRFAGIGAIVDYRSASNAASMSAEKLSGLSAGA